MNVRGDHRSRLIQFKRPRTESAGRRRDAQLAVYEQRAAVRRRYIVKPHGRHVLGHAISSFSCAGWVSNSLGAGGASGL
jgi:hypothetical protein